MIFTLHIPKFLIAKFVKAYLSVGLINTLKKQQQQQQKKPQ